MKGKIQLNLFFMFLIIAPFKTANAVEKKLSGTIQDPVENFNKNYIFEGESTRTKKLIGESLEPAIIELIINNSHREESFPVYLNNDDDRYPWMDIEELLYIIGIKTYEIKGEDLRYIINGEWFESRMKISKYEGVDIFYVGDLEEYAIWSPDSYVLILDLPYELPKDFLTEQSRKRNEFDRQQDEIELIKEQWKLFTPGILKLGYGRRDLTKNEDYLDLNYINHILYGTSEINASLEKGKFNVNTYRWKRYLPNERAIIIGDNYISNPANVGDGGSFRGISVYRKDSWDTSIKIDDKTIEGFSSNGQIAELYENGILKSHQIIRNGKYKFIIETSGGNKNYEVWIYEEDGDIIKKSVSIYGNIDLLNKNQFDYEFNVGENMDNHKIVPYNLNLLYGITEDFTLKVGGYNTIEKNKKNNYLNISPNFRLGSTGKWSHMFWGDYSQNTYHWNQNYSGVQFRSSNSIVVNTFGYESYNGFDEKSINESYDQKQYWRIRFPVYDSNLSFSYEKEQNNFLDHKLDRYGMTLYSSFFQGLISTSMGVQVEGVKTTFENKDYKTSGNFGINYNVRNQNLLKIVDTIGIDYSGGIDHYNRNKMTHGYGIYFRRRSKVDRDLDYYLNLRSRNNEFSVEFSISYKLGGALNITSSNYIDNYGDLTNEIKIETAINLGAPLEEKVFYRAHMGDSNISGVIYKDINNNGIMDEDEEGISEFSLKTLGKTWETDEEGKFYMPLLSSNTRRMIEVKNENEDILNYTFDNEHYVRTLPGGELRLEIPVVPLKSLIGMIDFKREMYLEDIILFLENSVIKITNDKTSEEIFLDIEDEYFMKDFTVGKYHLEFDVTEDIEIIDENYTFEILYSNDDHTEEELYIDISLNEDGKYEIKVYQ